MAGISRSVSVLTYFFMKKYNRSYNDVYSIIRSKRSIADPNKSFVEQLKQYQILREKFGEKNAQNVIDNIFRYRSNDKIINTK